MKSTILTLLTILCAQADVKLPAVLSDSMVLQQGSPVRIWGRADPGEAITVSFHGQKASATADGSGAWKIYLKPLEGGGPYEMTVAGKNTITVKDVLVGEVWVGSGQSNMGFTMARVQNAEQEIAAANYPRMRLFKVKLKVAETPADDVEGSWQPCSPESVKNTSAVGYFFSREIHQERKVPVGFIESAWGGTPAEAWTSRPAMTADPALKSVFEEWDKTLTNYPAAHARYEKQLEAWKAGGKKTAAPRDPPGPGHQYTPGGLYNAMIAPLTGYAIRGVIWYQGENNANGGERAYLYRRLFSTLIEDWRRAWGEGEFPFLFVQLANLDKGPESVWPVLRESQVKALNLVKTGMAVTVDIGNSHDIHPTNKQDVGHRLALAARHIAYKESLEYSGPMFRQVSSEGNQLRVWFNHTGTGLARRGDTGLTGFMLAGADHNFVPAEASIDGKTVLVSSPDVKEPVAVRYGWAGDPVCNLINKEGLPASPFRSEE